MPRIDEFAKEYLHNDLRQIREALVWKLDGQRDTASLIAALAGAGHAGQA
jgi:hypothetical protein